MIAKILKSGYYPMIFALNMELQSKSDCCLKYYHQYYFKVINITESSTISIFEYFFKR
jgi:hypothetical protein